MIIGGVGAKPKAINRGSKPYDEIAQIPTCSVVSTAKGSHSNNRSI